MLLCVVVCWLLPEVGVLLTKNLALLTHVLLTKIFFFANAKLINRLEKKGGN